MGNSAFYQSQSFGLCFFGFSFLIEVFSDSAPGLFSNQCKKIASVMISKMQATQVRLQWLPYQHQMALLLSFHSKTKRFFFGMQLFNFVHETIDSTSLHILPGYKFGLLGFVYKCQFRISSYIKTFISKRGIPFGSNDTMCCPCVWRTIVRLKFYCCQRFCQTMHYALSNEN